MTEAEKKKAEAAAAAAAQAAADNRTALAAQGFTDAVVDAIPGLRAVYNQAIENRWVTSGQVGQQNFINAVKALPWVQANGTYMLDYIKAKTSASPDEWADQQRSASQAVRDAAVKVGAQLDDSQLAKMTDSYLMFGWNKPGREQNLTLALTGQLSWKSTDGTDHTFGQDFLTYGKGAAAATIARLRKAASENGVAFDDAYFEQAARAVTAGLGTEQDYLTDITNRAASANPVFADKIKAGLSVKSLASPYLQTMGKVFELDPNTISLDDPMIKQAMGQVDDKGNPVALGLWDFEKQLRRDDRFGFTKQAHDQVGNIAQSLMSMMGYGQ